MDIALAILIAALCWAFSGARSLAYALYFLSCVPFISLSAVEGGMTEIGSLAGDNVRFKLALRALCCCGFLFLLARRKDTLATIFKLNHAPLLILFAWALFWIQRSAQPWLSAFRLLELFSFFLAGIALYLESARFHPLRQVLRWHCLALWSLPLLGLWFTWSRPDLAQHVTSDQISRMGHKFLNANSLGFASTIVILWAISELRNAWRRSDSGGAGSTYWRYAPLLPLLTCSHVLIEAHSRTAVFTLALGLGILLWPHRSTSSMLRIACIGCALVLLGVWQRPTIESWMLRGESVENFSTATGRTELWSELLTEQVTQAPVAGVGYLMLSEQGGFQHAGREWTNAHNSYVFALVSCGVFGLIFLLLCVLLPWRASMRIASEASAESREPARLLCALFTVILATSIPGFGVFGHPNPSMFLFYSLFALTLAYPTSVRNAVSSAPDWMPPSQPLTPRPS